MLWNTPNYSQKQLNFRLRCLLLNVPSKFLNDWIKTWIKHIFKAYFRHLSTPSCTNCLHHVNICTSSPASFWCTDNETSFLPSSVHREAPRSDPPGGKLPSLISTLYIICRIYVICRIYRIDLPSGSEARTPHEHVIRELVRTVNEPCVWARAASRPPDGVKCI